MFLASNKTKDSLTLYLAQQLVDTSTVVSMMIATRESVMTNYESRLIMEASSHEEADTVIIMYAVDAVDAADAGFRVHIYSQDTYDLLLALRRVSQLGSNAAMIMGTGERRHKVMLQPIYNEAALINRHVLT